MTLDEFAQFFYFAGDRFKKEKVYRDHLNLTISGLAAVLIAIYMTGKTDGLGPVVLLILSLNIVITIIHYVTCYFRWRKEPK